MPGETGRRTWVGMPAPRRDLARWETLPLQDIALIEMGQSPPSESVREGLKYGLPFLQGNAEFAERYPRPVKSCVRPLKRADPGDVLVSVRAPVGAVNQADRPLCIGRGLAAIRFRGVDSSYGYHALRGFSSLLRRVAQGSTFEAVGSVQLGDFHFTLPPPPEQRRIAEILDTVDEAIQRTEELIAKLEEMKKGLLHDLLTRGIDENGELRDPERNPEQFKDSPLGRIPKEWEGPFRLDELEECGVLELGRGNVISAVDMDEEPGPYPVYSSSAKETGMFGTYGKYMFEEEMITWSIDGGGRPFYRPKHRYSVTNVCGYLRITYKSQWTCSFVHAIMEKQHSRITFDYQMKAHPSVIRELYWFARPNIEEQHRISGVRDAFSQRIASEKDVVRKLRSLKQALMNDLLTGRVRVTVPEPEEATA